MASIIDEKCDPNTQPTWMSSPATDWNDVWQRDQAADYGSRLLLAVATDFSLDDTVLDLDDYNN
ncbi:MAG: hypothetical protein CMF67_07920 [Magnetovibrio sp.]|nr:hypothetical protein [Magnetovibrio sp.]|tara:strand:- start:890 stop:1081 length:192 start_codon:yes stop_codon:yes gene_type:complete